MYAPICHIQIDCMFDVVGWVLLYDWQFQGDFS